MNDSLLEKMYHFVKFNVQTKKSTNNHRSFQYNLFGKPLEICSNDPITGYYRDGYCRTGPGDRGKHTVCAKVTNEFLDFSASKGNNLKKSSGTFPGLKHADYWCLCADRYKEALNNGIHLKVNPKASHFKTHEYLKGT